MWARKKQRANLQTKTTDTSLIPHPQCLPSQKRQARGLFTFKKGSCKTQLRAPGPVSRRPVQPPRLRVWPLVSDAEQGAETLRPGPSRGPLALPALRYLPPTHTNLQSPFNCVLASPSNPASRWRRLRDVCFTGRSEAGIVSLAACVSFPLLVRLLPCDSLKSDVIEW